MLVLNHHSQVPLYAQLYNQVRDAIFSGRLASHARLPSVRDLASQLSVSRNTVENAYLELYAEGYIYSKVRSGYFVSPISEGSDVFHTAAPPRPERLTTVATPSACRYDFHPARLDANAFPEPVWRKCIIEALREVSSRLNCYSDPQGEEPLRIQIQKYLEQSRGVVSDTSQIVICAGLQYGLDLVGHLLKDRQPLVAVEDPGYHLAKSVFLNQAQEVVPIPVRADGLDLDALQASRCNVAYVTPSHQFPTGCVMPVANRLKLIRWARAEGKVVIEDDYDSELRYHGKPIPSLQGLDPEGNIVYSGTFSKVLSPALRISYLVLPDSLLPKYRRMYKDYVCPVPLLEQRALALFMQQGHWERHVRRMRTLYRKKHDLLLRAVDRHFGDKARVIGQGAGLHVVLQLPGHPGTESELLTSALRNGARLFPYSETCTNAEPESATVLLGFGGLSPEGIEQGVKALYESWYL